MNPTRALEEQRLLLARLTQPSYADYMQRYQSSVEQKNAGPVMGTSARRPPGGDVFCREEIARLTMADTYFVSGEMVPLVQWAANDLDGTDVFDRTLWPSDHGFVWLDEPMRSIEAWGRTTSYVAMSWGRRVGYAPDGRPIPGVFVVFYTDVVNGDDEMNAEIRRLADENPGQAAHLNAMGRLHVAHLLWISDEQRCGPKELAPTNDPTDQSVQHFVVDPDRPDMRLVDSAPNPTRFVLAMLMMLNQTVAEVSEYHLDKKAARRMQFMGLPSRVTVVRLRRHSDVDRLEGETLVEWAHRWIVKGHWRNQPYKNADGTTRYERIWIAPYVKGPEDKPLKQSEKVYALVR